jgi:hypothetical protein
MNGAEIIKKFETQVDDITELSASDELDLLNKVYNDVWTDRPWEFSRKQFSGAISGTSIALPADFGYIYGDEKVVYVNGNKYTVINSYYRNDYYGNYCWVDVVNSLLVFSTPVSGTVTYDYIFFPADITLATSPVFPESFHHILYHLMATEDYIIQQSDKAKSYAPENQSQADKWLSKMRYWNANLNLN